MLPDYVRHPDINLVAMGTHGYCGLLKAFLGSTAQSLLHILDV